MLSPDDEALLSDLLDERLGAAEEAALSARLEREPALREAWDELVRAREFVRDAPDPVPPADFTARVRARLAAADASEDGAARTVEPTPLELPPLRETVKPAPRPPEVPLLWRRMMTVAYAAAAALILGIGLFALKDRERNAAPGETTMAQAPEAAKEARTEATLAKKVDGDALRLDDRDSAIREEDRRLERSAPEGKLEGWASEPKRDAEEADKGAPEAGVLKPHFGGPGGSVPPNLRAPSDSPAPPSAPSSGLVPPAPLTTPPPPPEPTPTSARPPAAPVPAPRGPVDARTAERPDNGEKRPGEDRSGLERLAGAQASDTGLGELLVLEATSVEAGRALLTSVVAGPGARARGSAPEGLPPAAAKSVVPLRRLDPSRDASLLAALRAQDAAAKLRAPAPAAPTTPPTTPPKSPAPYGVPLPGAPTPAPSSSSTPAPAPAPTPAPVAAPTAPRAEAPAGYGAPAAGGSGGSAPATALLGVEPRTFTAEEYARIVALLGPLDGATGGSEDAKKKDKPQPTRRVRVLIVRPAR